MRRDEECGRVETGGRVRCGGAETVEVVLLILRCRLDKVALQSREEKEEEGNEVGNGSVSTLSAISRVESRNGTASRVLQGKISLSNNFRGEHFVRRRRGR